MRRKKLIALGIILGIMVGWGWWMMRAQVPVVASPMVRDLRLYPDPSLTPGDVFTGVTAKEVCTPGYSGKVRDVPVAEKRQVYAEYGLKYPQAPGAYEADHFISLELGGSNDIKNLWPEPAEPRPGFLEKDEVENYLHEQLCSGRETLGQVQDEIRTDWYLVYRRIKSF